MNHDITRTNASEPVEDRPVFLPAVDIFENQDELLVVADLPGIDPGSLEINFEEERLTILGHRRHALGESARVLMGANPDWDYRRVFSVPDAVDGERIEAKLEAGVLTLRLPRHERAKPRRIQVSAS